MNLMEKQLSSSSSSYIAGGETISTADITLISPMDVIFSRFHTKDKDNNGLDLMNEYPNCYKWLQTMRARPAFQSAQERVNEQNDDGRITKDL